jgi:hypothetical protein
MGLGKLAGVRVAPCLGWRLAEDRRCPRRYSTCRRVQGRTLPEAQTSSAARPRTRQWAAGIAPSEHLADGPRVPRGRQRAERGRRGLPPALAASGSPYLRGRADSLPTGRPARACLTAAGGRERIAPSRPMGPRGRRTWRCVPKSSRAPRPRAVRGAPGTRRRGRARLRSPRVHGAPSPQARSGLATVRAPAADAPRAAHLARAGSGPRRVGSRASRAGSRGWGRAGRRSPPSSRRRAEGRARAARRSLRRA